MRTSFQPVRRHWFVLILCILLPAVLPVCAQVTLEADGITDTYALIENALGTGSADETSDCAHPEFGPHIRQSWDDPLGKYVFSFFIHVAPDNDRCLSYITDRQRNEIKVFGSSPDYLRGFYGDTCTYRWYFKIDSGFKASTNFTHIHQIKAGDGNDADMPLITITPRAASPERMNVIYTAPSAFGGTSSSLASADLLDFKGQWIEAKQRILYATNGTYELVLKRVSDGVVLLSCTNSDLNMWRGTATFNRPKWGIYRSLASSGSLRDEEVRFADFGFAKGLDTISNSPPSVTMEPENQTVLIGRNAIFTAAAGGSAPLSYQWRFNTTNVLAWATNATLTVPNIQSINEGDYSVVVTNAYGAATSSVATLTMILASRNVYPVSGTHMWTCPDNITSVQVECWGGGGAGGSAVRPASPGIGTGGGGAGGAYARYNSYPVIPGNTYYIKVGAGGMSSISDGDMVPGGDSWFNSVNEASAVILAKGGAGGKSVIVTNGISKYGAGGAGSSSGSFGDVVYAGGSGATSTGNNYGGGGGGSGGTERTGNNAAADTGLGATAVNGGGNGGHANPTAGSSGSGQIPTTPPGGGGGGARSGSTVQQTGGAGADGQVILIYAVELAAGFSASPTNGGAPLTVTFTDTSTGVITNRFWSFGDGITTNTAATNLSHTYQIPGTSTVTLIVSDAIGSSTGVQTNLIIATSIDTVGDGVPDWWRARYFGGDGTATNAGSGAAVDFDNDGIDNLSEYIADTIPTDETSRFALGLTVAGNVIRLGWTGGSNAWQFIEYRTDLTDTNHWIVIHTNAPPTAVTNTIDFSSAERMFYRIKARR